VGGARAVQESIIKKYSNAEVNDHPQSGWLEFPRQRPGNAKARQGFKRGTCNRVQSTRFVGQEISISLVWIKMLPEDSKEKARVEAGNFTDSLIHHFYDPNKRSGTAIAESLGYKERVAWDIYLFYSAGVAWTDAPPAPTAWMHQLSETWIDREHYHSGDDLVRELFLATQRLLSS
jgi:hypothetical protein